MPRAGEKNFEGEASVSSRGADAKTRRASRVDAKNARFAPTRMDPSVRMDRVASSGRSQRRVERERAPRFGASTGISPIPTVPWLNLVFAVMGAGSWRTCLSHARHSRAESARQKMTAFAVEQ